VAQRLIVLGSPTIVPTRLRLRLTVGPDHGSPRVHRPAYPGRTRRRTVRNTNTAGHSLRRDMSGSAPPL
jgi:hypothetical protein